MKTPILFRDCEYRTFRFQLKSGKKNSKPRQAAPKDPASSLAAVAPAIETRLSPLKLWCFRAAALVLVPLILLGALELGLRVAGYGYPTSFFKNIRIRKSNYLVENDKFGLRFFPPTQARSPAPVVMKAEKGAGAYRIFILGESAALGDPRPAYGPGRYLQAILRERFPGVEFEVVSAAMTAINSHAILPIANECAGHEGDAWIIYMGNNEMVGPFGAATVFGAQAPPRLFVRLTLAAQKMRLGQLASELIQKIRNRSSQAGTWGGMQMFMNNRVAPDDHRKQTVYKNYSENLNDILRTGLRAGANVLLSTVAVNLKDCPPFASVLNTNLPAEERGKYDQFYAEAVAAESQGNLSDAEKRYEEAAKLEPHFSE